jgi:hypothetical protein
MAERRGSLTRNTFIKGLITEAEALTFPENASIEEENYELLRDGSRRRRLGIDYETEYALSTSSFATLDIENAAIQTFVWKAPNNDTSVQILVIQVGDELRFHLMSSGNSTSSSIIRDVQPGGPTIDVIETLVPVSGFTTAADVPCDFATGLGLLFVASDRIAPFYLSYDPTVSAQYPNGNIDKLTLTTRVRDLEGVDDGLEVDETPVALSELHKYNLINQGWVNGSTVHYTDYFTSRGNYPSNAQTWWVGKDENDDLDPVLLEKQDFGTERAPRGHILFDPFTGDRSTPSGATVPSLPFSGYPTSVTFWANRLFYVADTVVYFTQQFRDKLTTSPGGGATLPFHSVADLTTQDTAGIVATDGGYIFIPDMGKATGILAFRNSVLVFSEEGVWAIQAASKEGSAATDLVPTRISEEGCRSFRNFVVVGDTVAYLADSGINLIQQDQVSGDLFTTSLTEQTIQDEYLRITQDAREQALITYDKSSRKVHLFYNNDTTFTKGTFNYKYNSVLSIDTVLGSWYKFSIKSLSTLSPFVAGAFISPKIVTDKIEQIVVDDSGSHTVDSSGNKIVLKEPTDQAVLSSLQMLTFREDDDFFSYTISEFKNTSWLDWEAADGTGVDAAAFVITGFELVNDPSKDKGVDNFIPYMKRTESKIVLDSDGNLTQDRPSGGTVTFRTQWTTSSNSNKWASPEKVYNTAPNGQWAYSVNDLIEHGFTVSDRDISDFRGRGRAFNVRFDSEPGKDMHILGFSYDITLETR